jgi:hypothetical protein
VTLSSRPLAVRIPLDNNNNVNRSNFFASFWRLVVSLLSKLLEIFFSANDRRNYHQHIPQGTLQAAPFPATTVVDQHAEKEMIEQS